MKKYHYSDGQNQFGPLDIEELKEKQIKKDTLVWYEGLANWTKAGDIQELSLLFKAIPPPLNTSPPPPLTTSPVQPPAAPSKKKSNTVLILSIVGGLAIIFLIIVFNQNNSSSYVSGSSNTYVEPPREKTPEELRQELAEKERMNPLEYIKIDAGKMEANMVKTREAGLFHSEEYSQDGWNINANITNSATLAKYKLVVIKVSYLSETGTLLSNEDIVFDKFFEPNSVTPWLQKVYGPEGDFDKFRVEIKSASAVQ